MNKATLSGVVVAVGFLAAAGVYVAVPSLRGPEATAAAEVRAATERARRLLAKVGENQERLAVVLDGLRAAGVVELDDQLVADLVESDRELLVNAEERLQGISREVQRRRQTLQSEYPLAEKLPLPALQARFGANVPQMTQAIRDGLAARDRLLAENEGLLDEAWQAVQEGSGVQHGEASGADDPEVLRLEGLVLYAQGTAAQRQAARVRQRAAAARNDLLMVAAESARLAKGRDLVPASGIEQRISELRGQETQLAAQVAEQKAAVEQLRGTVSRLEADLAEQQAAAEASRARLDALSKESADLKSADEFQAFAGQYSQEAQTYREALRRAQVIEFGALENAAIDRTGDFLEGEYVPADDAAPIRSGWGLLHYRHELATADARMNDAENGLTALRDKLAALERQKAALAQQAADTVQRLEAIRTRSAEHYARLTEADDNAWKLEDGALQKLGSAARSFGAARQATLSLQSAASAALGGLASDASERLAESRLVADQWTPASDQAREADALLRLATVHYQRYRDSTLDAEVLAALGDSRPPEADPAEAEALAVEARGAGLDAAHEAVDALFAASRDLQQHFAITAEIATAYHLQALFGEEGMLAAAERNYAVAIEGREDSPFVAQYRERLEQLRRMRQSSKTDVSPPTNDSGS